MWCGVWIGDSANCRISKLEDRESNSLAVGKGSRSSSNVRGPFWGICCLQRVRVAGHGETDIVAGQDVCNRDVVGSWISGDVAEEEWRACTVKFAIFFSPEKVKMIYLPASNIIFQTAVLFGLLSTAAVAI
jgi:hypothetical protein